MTKRKRIPQKVRDRVLVDAMHRCCLCPEHHEVVDLHHVVQVSECLRWLLSLLQQRRLLLVLDGFERELRAYAGLSAAYQGDVDQDRAG